MLEDLRGEGNAIVFRQLGGDEVRVWNHNPDYVERLTAAGVLPQYAAAPYNLLGFDADSGQSLVGVEAGEYQENACQFEEQT